MRFLSPLALAGLALVTLPVIIHLLVRRQAKRFAFPSLKFLRETPSFRLRPRRVQQPLLLALRLAAIILIVIGLSRPLISFNNSSQAITHIILLDASLSMSAQGREASAREQAKSVIENLAQGERGCVVAFASESVLLSEMTSDKRELRAAVERYQVQAGTADYAAAFAFVNALLQREQTTEAVIDLISDFQRSGLTGERINGFDAGMNASARVVAHPVGARLERNAFMTDERVTAGESGIELYASEIIAADGRSGARRKWMIGGNENAGADVSWRVESNGQIAASIRTLAADDFDADDERFLVFAQPRKPRALLVERDGDDAIPYLRAALEALAKGSGQNHLLLERKSELPRIASELNEYALLVLMIPPRPLMDEMRVLADYASAGGTVWLCAGREVDAAAWNEFAKTDEGRALPFVSLTRKDESKHALSFGAVDAGAPALRLMEEPVLNALRGVRLREGYAVAPRHEAATLMRWNDGAAAMVEANQGSGSLLLLASSPARASGELGISNAFPALVSSIALYSLAPREPLSCDIGEPVNLKLQPDAMVKIVDAKGQTETAQARDLLIRPASYFREAGIYKVESGGLVKFLAFNAPLAESESALAASDEIKRYFDLSKSEKQASANSAGAEMAERQKQMWRYLLAAAFLLLLTELFISLRHRRQAKIETVQDETSAPTSI